MKAIHRSATGRSGRKGPALAATITDAHCKVIYGDIVQDIRGTDYYIVQASQAPSGEWKVTAVDQPTWRAIREAEQMASGMIPA